MTFTLNNRYIILTARFVSQLFSPFYLPVVAFAVYRWQVRLCMAEQGVQGVQGEPGTAAG